MWHRPEPKSSAIVAQGLIQEWAALCSECGDGSSAGWERSSKF